jgi:hypothetical protein
MPLLQAALPAAAGALDSDTDQEPTADRGVARRGLFDGHISTEESGEESTSQVESEQSGQAYNPTGRAFSLSLLSLMSCDAPLHYVIHR